MLTNGTTKGTRSSHCHAGLGNAPFIIALIIALLTATSAVCATGLAATGIATQAQSVMLRAAGAVAIGVLIMLSIPHLPLDVAHFKVVSIFAAISRV